MTMTGAAAGKGKRLMVALAVGLLVAAMGQLVRARDAGGGGMYCVMSVDSGTNAKIGGCLQTYRQTNCVSQECCQAIQQVGGAGCLGQLQGLLGGDAYLGDGRNLLDGINANCNTKIIGYNV